LDSRTGWKPPELWLLLLLLLLLRESQTDKLRSAVKLASEGSVMLLTFCVLRHLKSRCVRDAGSCASSLAADS
jgi:hypothetical protein